MDIRFDGKRVLVTGAGKGIGRETCLLLAKCGAKVIALSRTEADLKSLKEEIKDCEIILADITNAEAAKKAAEKAGDVDLLVNNAAIAKLQPFLETTVEAFDETFAVNVRAVLIISQIIAKGMIKRGKGAIVNLSSQASLVGLQDHTSYCTSKGALDQLTRMMALELGPHNIRVNSVNPTVVLTPMGELGWSKPEKRDPMIAKIPLGRFAKPIEVAHTIAYLLSDYSSMINGAILPIDGGYLAAG